MLIGKDFKPYYAKDRGANLGVTTWPPGQWKRGGATVWGWISYDPQLNLIYYGTSNPGVWNPDVRPGANKWSSSIIARNPDTGQVRWAYQISPHDAWDYDEIMEKLFPLYSGVLATADNLVFYGTMTGWFRAVDARTGKILWQFKTGSGIIGDPITFLGPDKKQYVAIYSGVVGAMAKIKKYTSPGDAVYVFGL